MAPDTVTVDRRVGWHLSLEPSLSTVSAPFVRTGREFWGRLQWKCVNGIRWSRCATESLVYVCNMSDSELLILYNVFQSSVGLGKYSPTCMQSCTDFDCRFWSPVSTGSRSKMCRLRRQIWDQLHCSLAQMAPLLQRDIRIPLSYPYLQRRFELTPSLPGRNIFSLIHMVSWYFLG